MTDNDLYLDHAGLEKIDKNAFNNRNLKYIQLTENKLSDLPEPDVELNVTVLDISKNNFKKLPIPFLKKTNVMSINAEENHIESIDGIENVKNLTEIRLSLNKIDKFPKGLGQFEFLSNVSLSHNLIVDLDNNEHTKLNVRQMTLSGNRISRGGKFANYVERLELEGNNIHNFAELNLPKVVILGIRNNPFTHLDVSKEDFAMIVSSNRQIQNYDNTHLSNRTKEILSHCLGNIPVSKYEECKTQNYCGKSYTQFRLEVANELFKEGGEWRKNHPDASDVELMRERDTFIATFNFYTSKVKKSDGTFTKTAHEFYTDAYRTKRTEEIFAIESCRNAYNTVKIDPKDDINNLVESLAQANITNEQITQIQERAKNSIIDEVRPILHRLEEKYKSNRVLYERMKPIFDYAREQLGEMVKGEKFDVWL